MAEFCQQCAEEVLGWPEGDFAGLGDPPPGEGWHVLCEGCGDTLVDAAGRCIAEWCPEHGNAPGEHACQLTLNAEEGT